MDIKDKLDVEIDPDMDEDVGTDEEVELQTDGQLALAPAETSEGEAPVTREQRRSRRKREIRARTISVKRMTKRELEIGRLLYPEHDYEKPKMRSECVDGARPCPFVSCKHHLYLDVNPETGSIKLNFPDLEVWDMADTCSLDVADRGGITLEEVGEILNLTRERIRQVEVRGLLKLKMVGPGEEPLPGDPGYGVPVVFED